MIKKSQNEPFLSIIIPTYNRADSIGRTINSVLCQTYPNFELIVVDDCSVDHTKEIVCGFHDERISYKRLQERQGAPVARNVGLSASKAMWVSFLDSDDEWLPNRIEKHFEQISSDHKLSDIYYCLISHSAGDRDISLPTKCYEKDISKELISHQTGIYPTQAIVRKSSALGVNGFDPNLACLQDLDFFLRLSLHGNLFKCIPEVLALKHPSYNGLSITNSLDNQIEGTRYFEEKWGSLMRKTSLSCYLSFKIRRATRVDTLYLKQSLQERNKVKALLYLGKIIPATFTSYSSFRFILRYFLKIIFGNEYPQILSKVRRSH